MKWIVPALLALTCLGCEPPAGTVELTVTEARRELGHSTVMSESGENFGHRYYYACTGTQTDGEAFAVWWRNVEDRNSPHTFEDGKTYRIDYEGDLGDGALGYKGDCIHLSSIRTLTEVNP